MCECVVAFGADSSQVAWVVAAACVYWCDVIYLCRGCLVAYRAHWLFSKYDPPIFKVLRVFVCLAHNALARADALAFGLCVVMFVVMFASVVLFYVTSMLCCD